MTDTQPCLSGDAPANGHAGLGHIVPLWVLLAVFAALIGLTVLTVTATRLDVGAWNLVLAMAIATVKATLVALYFMHLRYDHPFYGLILITALLFMALFISITLMDTKQYQGEIRTLQEEAVGRGL